jgi:hypothetical protein
MSKESQPPTQDKVNAFLDSLRLSGIVNMFGASPILSKRFGINYLTAKDFLVEWMDTFSEREQKKSQEKIAKDNSDE